MVKKCKKLSEAITLRFTDKSAIEVIDGHHTLG